MYHMLILKSREKKIFTIINVVPGKKIHGRSTVISHYHYHMGSNMGEYKCELRRKPCYCVAHTNLTIHVFLGGNIQNSQYITL